MHDSLLKQQSRKKKPKGKQKKGKLEEELKGQPESDRGGRPEKQKLCGDALQDSDSDVWNRASSDIHSSFGNDHVPLSALGWKRISSSDSEYSDAEGGMQSKTRLV